MSKFRKKSVAIEAEQFWPDKKPWPDGIYEPGGQNPPFHLLDTAVGMGQIVRPGDWVVRSSHEDMEYMGVSICKPDIFEVTYEPVA